LGAQNAIFAPAPRRGADGVGGNLPAVI